MKLQLLKSARRLPLAAAAAVTLMVASAAHADVEAGKLVLAGFTDAADGELLMAGNYAAVIQKLAGHSMEFKDDQVAASTNLCVAYVASHQMEAAHGACDEAIRMAKLDQFNRSLEERMEHQDPLSIAYANRAVLSKLSGE